VLLERKGRGEGRGGTGRHDEEGWTLITIRRGLERETQTGSANTHTPLPIHLVSTVILPTRGTAVLAHLVGRNHHGQGW